MRKLGGQLLLIWAVATAAATRADALDAGKYIYTPLVVGTDTRFTAQGTGINEFDTVVGMQTFAIPKKNPLRETFGKEGFVWRNGTVTIFGAPAGATFVGSGRINRDGVALAYDTLADGTYGSFTYDTVTGMTHQLLVPGASSVTATWISKVGTIAGSVTLGGSTLSHSFVTWHGITTIFDPPGALASSAGFVGADGTVSGSFYVADPKVTSGYVYKNGTFSILNSPYGSPFEGYAKTSAGYVGPHGVVIGGFDVAVEQTGFLYKDGVYSSPVDGVLLRILKDGTLFGFSYGTNDHIFAFGPHAHGYLFPPGVFTTFPYDVNENGEFVGYITTITNNYEPVVATCPAAQAPCY